MHHVSLSMLLSLCICLSLCLTLLHECSAETRPVPTAAAKSRVAGNIEIHSRSETRTRFGKGIKVRVGKKFGDEVETVQGDSDGTETGPEIQTSTERTMSEITKATSEARTNIKAEADSDIIKADGGSRTRAKTDAGVKTWNGLDTIYNDPDVRGMTSMNVPRWMEELILHLERTVQQQSASLREMKVWQGRVQARLAQLEAQTLRHEGKLRKLRDTGRNNSLATAHHRKEIGRLSGCLRGRWISGRCYLLFREYASHEQAASRCEETGGSLAAPSDATTRRAIARYARSAVSGNWFVWIGVTDHTAEGVYIYSDGSRVISAPWYRAYPVVQPNGGRAENCVVFTVGDGAWWDSPCNGRHLFLCQYAF